MFGQWWTPRVLYLGFAIVFGNMIDILFIFNYAAYVYGEREGLILETPCVMGETLNGTHGLDIDAEKELVEETLKQFKVDNLDEDSVKSAMKDLGLLRFVLLLYSLYYVSLVKL